MGFRVYYSVRSGQRQLSRYHGMLRGARTGDRILMVTGARFYASVQTDPGGHSASSTMGTGHISWKQSGRGMALTTHPRLVLRLKKNWTNTTRPPLGLHGLFWGGFYLLCVSVSAKDRRDFGVNKGKYIHVCICRHNSTQNIREIW